MGYQPLDTTKKFLVTGAAGFIGSHLCQRLLQKGCRVIGFDCVNDYYDVNLKYARLNRLTPFERFTFIKSDLSDQNSIAETFALHKPDIVVHLAAQAGVRYSFEKPELYIQSNIIGFYNILQACKKVPVEHLVYASSSSVYGVNKKVPFSETDCVDNPVSLYAVTKKSNELMAQTYSRLFHIPSTGLRFFTVYGPYGRPDMAYYAFANDYFAGKPIRIYNNGDFKNDLMRDFTYIDDIIEGVERILNNPPGGEEPSRIFNIGNNRPEKLMKFIGTLEKCLSNSTGREVVFQKVYEPIQAGDVPVTYASIDRIRDAVGFEPKTSLQEGLQKFTDWYIDYYKLK
ncbi:MAG: NAD-dependent epimerase/dehydratase family protein [Christensenellales bacterium]